MSGAGVRRAKPGRSLQRWPAFETIAKGCTPTAKCIPNPPSSSLLDGVLGAYTLPHLLPHMGVTPVISCIKLRMLFLEEPINSQPQSLSYKPALALAPFTMIFSITFALCTPPHACCSCSSGCGVQLRGQQPCELHSTPRTTTRAPRSKASHAQTEPTFSPRDSRHLAIFPPSHLSVARPALCSTRLTAAGAGN